MIHSNISISAVSGGLGVCNPTPRAREKYIFCKLNTAQKGVAAVNKLYPPPPPHQPLDTALNIVHNNVSLCRKYGHCTPSEQEVYGPGYMFHNRIFVGVLFLFLTMNYNYENVLNAFVKLLYRYVSYIMFLSFLIQTTVLY